MKVVALIGLVFFFFFLFFFFLIGSSFCGGFLGILSNLAIMRKRRERWLLYFNCVVTVCVSSSRCRGLVWGL